MVLNEKKIKPTALLARCCDPSWGKQQTSQKFNGEILERRQFVEGLGKFSRRPWLVGNYTHVQGRYEKAWRKVKADTNLNINWNLSIFPTPTHIHRQRIEDLQATGTWAQSVQSLANQQAILT